MSSLRRAKGINLIAFVKMLKGLRKRRPIGLLSEATEAVLRDRVLISSWYSFDVYRELMNIVTREILHGSDASALEMGIMGGREAFTDYHKQYVAPGDPLATLIAMRHTWRVYYNFGELSVTSDGARAAAFELTGYPDLRSDHGHMIVGWHVASARIAGAETASSEILEAPWRGANRLIHRVSF